MLRPRGASDLMPKLGATPRRLTPSIVGGQPLHGRLFVQSESVHQSRGESERLIVSVTATYRRQTACHVLGDPFLKRHGSSIPVSSAC